MKYFKKLNLHKIYISILIFSFFGYSVLVAERRRDVFPFSALYTFAHFPYEVKKVIKDLINGENLSLTPNEVTDKSAFHDLVNNTKYNIKGIKVRANQNILSPTGSRRMIVGIFNIDGIAKHAALALSPELEIEHVWPIKSAFTEEIYKVGGALFLHAFTLMNDSSIIFSFDENVPSFRMDHCGNPIWKSKLNLHHAITPIEDENYVWGLNREGPAKVNVETGEAVRIIRFSDLVSANSEISVFDIRQLDDNAIGTNNHDMPINWLEDPVHFNDVEPLPENIADKFPMFKAGDLLMSSRSLNMIVVIDPETLKIKWKTIGLTMRQHDPDWGINGKITVFDNRMGEGFSRIISIDPATEKVKVLLDGEKINFYSRIRGKHQMLDDGGILVASSQQGRIFEVNSAGELSLEILVTAPEYDNMNYVVSDAFRLPTGFVIKGENICSN